MSRANIRYLHTVIPFNKPSFDVSAALQISFLQFPPLRPFAYAPVRTRRDRDTIYSSVPLNRRADWILYDLVRLERAGEGNFFKGIPVITEEERRGKEAP